MTKKHHQTWEKHSHKELRLYTLWQILLWSIPSPYAGIYMIAQNYEAMWMENKKRRVFSVGSIICLLFASIMVLAPESFEKIIPDYLFVVLWILLLYLYFERTQLPTAKRHLKSWWKSRSLLDALFVSFLSFIIFMILFIVIQISYDLIAKYAGM